MKDVCTEVSCELFQAYKWCKAPSCPRKKRRWDTCGLTENSILVDSGARGEKVDAQIGEDKSHPFAESVMMGMDGGENG